MIIGMAEITRILEAVQQGDLQAAAELFPLVYEEMRKVASQKMAHEAPGHTLQSTELVHEAWLRLAGSPSHEWQNRAHFFGAAAEAMRRILVERARRRHRLKRGGQWERVGQLLLRLDHRPCSSARGQGPNRGSCSYAVKPAEVRRVIRVTKETPAHAG